MKLRWNLGLKLHAAIAGLSIFSVLLAGITIYQLASASAEKAALQTTFSQLEATRSAKAMEIEHYFQTISNQLVSLSDNLMVIEAVQQFSQAAAKLPTISASQSQQLDDYYKKDFATMYKQKNPDSTTSDVAHPHQLDDTAAAMQFAYLVDNPHPLGKKDLLHAGDNLHDANSDYGRTHQKYHFHFRQIQQHMGYYDLFLIEPEQGRVVYSVFKELDFGTRLNRGPWHDSALADAYRGAMQLDSEDEVFLTDMTPYTPSYEAQALFMASQIRHEGHLIGVLVMQVPITEINKVMTSNYDWQQAGAGESGESYLIGADLTMRSASRFHHDDEEAFLQSLKLTGVAKSTLNKIHSHHEVIGLVKVDSHAARSAIADKTGVEQDVDYRGIAVLSAFQPLDIPGQTWGLISEVDQAEALADVYALQAKSKQTIIMITALLALLALLFGSWFTRRLIRPMHAVTDQLKALSEGVVGHEKVIYSGQDEIGDLVEAGCRLDNRLRHAIAQFKYIGEGDFSQSVDVRSQADALGQALLQMNQMLRELAQVAATVASGDYSVEVKVKGEHDQLGRSLEFMTRSLREAAEQSETQDWLKSSLNDISRDIQGKGSTEDIADTVMRLLPPMLGATHAAFYVWKEEASHLSLKGQYALDVNNLPDQVRPGECLTGQCAHDKRLMLIDDVPEDYLRIGSSLGSALPKQLIEVPLLADGALAGVIELASLTQMS
ncbi:MAG: HAMP domain-containing protein, partial [Mariprofundaceae bacterium]